jgi:excisionase family DNA binding protein
MKKRKNIDGPDDGDGDELVDKLYVAGCFGISIGMVDQLRRDKKLRAIKIGRKVRFEHTELKRYLKSEQEGGDGAGSAVVKNGGNGTKPAGGRGGRRQQSGAR